jgi:hypothetical protein
MDVEPIGVEKSGVGPGSDLVVVLIGLVTTLIALGGVYALNLFTDDLNLMGLYIVFVIPAGAIMVGIVAGSGYGIMSWFTGRKVGGGLLVAVLVLQILAYGAAQWVEFKSLQLVYENGEPVSFFDYFDHVTRSMTFSSRHSSTESSALGAWGYLFRLLELAGFALGGLVIPAALRTKPYCERCRTYMRTRTLVWLPAAVPTRKIPKKDTGAQLEYEQEMKQAFEQGMELAKGVTEAAASADAAFIRNTVDRHAGDKKQILKLLHRIEVKLSACPSCDNGLLVCVLSSGFGDSIQTQNLAEQPVTAGLVQSLR